MTSLRIAMAVPLAAFVAAATAARAGDAKWGPYIDLEGKPGTQRNFGEADLFVPLAQGADSLLFTDIRTRLDDQGSREGNFGLGVRHMLESGWNLGGVGYFDRRRSPYGNFFDQTTLGAEALSRDWDLRANGYLPVGTDSRPVDSLNSATLSGASVVFRGGEERALSGFDAELGWRVPVFAADAGQQVRVYAGGYRFASDGVPEVAGPRGRAEIVFDAVPHLWEGSRLSLGAEIQHDAPRGTEAFGDIRLRIPLEVFGRPSSTLTAQERRMEDPVIRDVDIVSQAGAYGPPETATETASGQSLTVVSSASTTGAGLPAAIAAAGANSTVILSGSFSPTATTTLQSGQTVIGGGALVVRSPSGRTATLTLPGATITGNVGLTNFTVAMAVNSTLEGMTINNTDNTGNNALAVGVKNISGVSIIGNTLNATVTGGGGSAQSVLVENTNGSDPMNSIIIRGNAITASGNGLAAYAIQVNGGFWTVGGATLAGNTLSASGSGTNDAVKLVSATVATGSTGNVKSAGSCNDGGGNTGTMSFTDGSHCP